MANAQASSSRRAQVSRESPEDEEDSGDEERLTKPIAGDAIEVDEDGLQDWTVETYVQQLQQKSASSETILSKVLTDLKAMEANIEKSFEHINETAMQIEDNSPDDEMIEDLAKGLRRAIEIRAIIKIKTTAIKVIKAKINKGDEIADPAGTFEKETADRTEEYMKKTSRQKFATEEAYSEFRSNVWSVNHSNQACPPMSHWLDREEGDVSDDDDDVEIGPRIESYKCAITHMPIKEAMINPPCKHHYSKAEINQLFTQASGRAGYKSIKCPSVGCASKVAQNEIQPDQSYQAKADNHFARETQRTQREQDEIDVEDFTQDD